MSGRSLIITLGHCTQYTSVGEHKVDGEIVME